MPLTPEEIKNRLVTNEEELQKQILDRMPKHITLDSTGRVHVNPGNYRDRDRISLYLLGKKFAALARMVTSDSATLKEISDNVGLQEKPASARLSDLRKDHLVESTERSMWRIVFARASQILDEIESKNPKGDKNE